MRCDPLLTGDKQWTDLRSNRQLVKAHKACVVCVFAKARLLKTRIWMMTRKKQEAAVEKPSPNLGLHN